MIEKPTEDRPHYENERQQAEWGTGALWSFHYQEQYQSSLGRMLVRFNEVEAMVGEILQAALDHIEKPHLFRVNDYFMQKVDRLELALCAFPKWPKVDFDRLRRINNWRNDLAHGHFHQDPNSGEWQTRGVHRKGQKSEIITPVEIDKWTEEVRLAYSDVGQLLPWVRFWLPGGVAASPTD